MVRVESEGRKESRGRLRGQVLIHPAKSDSFMWNTSEPGEGVEGREKEGEGKKSRREESRAEVDGLL